MKQYRIRLTIFMILSYLILSGVLFISYYMITNNFLNKRAEENISVISETVKNHVALNLQDDYERFVSFYNLYKDETNPAEEMIINIDNLQIQENSFSGFGYINNDGFSLNNIDYSFKPIYFTTTYFNINDSSDMSYKNITICSFSDILEGNTDEEFYLVFRYENVIGYLNANNYFASVFIENEKLTYDYYLIHKDGYIFLANDEKYSSLRFGEYISNEFERSDFFEKINNRDYDLLLLQLQNNKTYLSFQNVYFGTNENSVFILQAFQHKNVISSFSQLTQSLIFTYIVASLIFISFLFISYKFSELKFADVEDARISHYYDKPYIIYINKKGKILSVNKVVKNKIREYKKLKTIFDFDTAYKFDVLESINKQKNISVILKTKESEIYIRFIPIKYMFKYALIGEDVTNQEMMFSKYKSIAYFNQVTNLPNAYHLKFDLETTLNNPKGNSKDVLAKVSIKNFNGLDNLFGEQLLNTLLLEIKLILANLIQPYKAKLYHLYYDHFAILFNGEETFEEKNNIIANIMANINKVLDFENNKLNLDFRIGVFNIDSENIIDLNVDKVIRNSDLALKKAESLQSRKIAYYDITLGQSLTKRELMEEDLHKAIEKDEFIVFLQPQYSVAKNKIVSFEALVRWNNPKYINDSPQEFISLAESNNMIVEIGKIIINKTMELAKKLEDYNVKISINISPAQMLQAGFITELIESIDKYKVKKEMIAVEVTETFLMSNFMLVIEKLKQLKKYGMSIHLDDFGTGHSSMLYLKELPIDTIKIDKQFVDTILSDKYSKAIINMIISLAKSLDLEVIAEGIENVNQYKALKKMGCGIIQGYYIGKGMQFDKALALLNEINSKTKGMEDIDNE